MLCYYKGINFFLLTLKAVQLIEVNLFFQLLKSNEWRRTNVFFYINKRAKLMIFRKISNIILFFSEMNYEDVFFFNVNIAHRLVIIVRSIGQK